MKIQAKTRTEQVLTVMYILAWVAFVGYLIEAGAVLLSYAVSLVNPETAKDLYKGMNLYNLRKLDFWYYTHSVSFMVVLTLIKAYVAFLAIKTLSKVNLLTPFTMEVAHLLEKISHALFGAWLVGMLSSAYSAWLIKRTGEFFGTWVTGEFIFMAGLVFLISQIFKRGVEIQSENDLTV